MLFNAAAVKRLAAVHGSTRGGLGGTRKPSPLWQPLQHDSAELFARIATGFYMTRTTRTDNLSVYGTGYDGLLRGTAKLDDTPPAPDIIAGRIVGHTFRANNKLPLLQSVPSSFRKLALACKATLTAPEMRVLLAFFPASAFPLQYRFQVSQRVRRAWGRYAEEVGKRSWAAYRKDPEKCRVSGQPLPNSMRVGPNGTVYQDEAMNQALHLGRGQYGQALGALRAKNRLSRLLGDFPNIEAPLLVREYARRRQQAIGKLYTFPGPAAIACVLGCSRMHAHRLYRSALRKLRKAGLWPEFAALYGVWGGRIEHNEAAPETDEDDIGAFLAERARIGMRISPPPPWV